jgi:hypothetical protein
LIVYSKQAFTYALKKSKLDTADELRAFSFELHDKDRVKAFISSIDKCMFFTKADMDPFGGVLGGASVSASKVYFKTKNFSFAKIFLTKFCCLKAEAATRDCAFHDKSSRQSTVVSSKHLDGNRIVVTKTYMSDKRMEVVFSLVYVNCFSKAKT